MITTAAPAMTYQAIETRFCGPTNSRGTRIIATAGAGRRIYSWNDALNVDANHRGAAELFAQSFGWAAWSTMHTGVLASGARVHVLVRNDND